MTQRGKSVLNTEVASLGALWRALANAGAEVTAEALTSQNLERLHVPTALEGFVLQQVDAGHSVVLTGNAGDGKTHVLRRLAKDLAERNAVVIEDATASMHGGAVEPVLAAWRSAHAQGRPVCIAANEFPLHQLRQAGQGEAFGPLMDVDDQCRHRLTYGSDVEAPLPARSKVVVIDLSLRNPLAPAFFNRLLDQLLVDPELSAMATADGDPIAFRNAQRIREPRVRARLDALAKQLVALGGRTTVRELWIFAARMLLSTRRDGRDCQMSDWYSEVLFSPDERFQLASAFAKVDPARCSHPLWDARLEAGDLVREGWVKGLPAIPPHPELRPNAFAALKRAFYFEHEEGLAAIALADPDASAFSSLLRSGAGDANLVKRTLVKSLNAAYSPVAFPGSDDHLYLWNGHRFHDHPSRAFVASDRVSGDLLSIELPALPARLENALDYEPDHLALTFAGPQGPVRLRIDFALFQTLQRIGRGMPRKLVPERDLHRIDAFIEKVSAQRPVAPGAVWSAHLEHRQVLQIALGQGGQRYDQIDIHE